MKLLQEDFSLLSKYTSDNELQRAE